MERVVITEEQKRAIEAVLSKGDRVELIPVKEGIRVVKVHRSNIKQTFI